MIDLYFKLIIFFTISFAYFFSIVGYGKVITNKNSNYFEAYLDGTILLLIISYSIYVTIGTSLIINIVIIFVGLILFFQFNKELKSIKNKYIFYLFLSIFLVLVISKTHEDFNSYHYFSIFEIFNHNLRIGVSNLNERFFHSSLLALNQSIIILPYFDYKLVHLPSFFIYFSVIGYFITILLSNDKNNKEVFYSLLCLLILLIKFNRLSEYGYDYISQFILLIIFHKIYFLHSNNSEIIKSIIYFLLCVLIKPISLLFLPIMIFIIYKRGVFFYKNISVFKYSIIIALLTILFSSSFFKTGCFFYPLNKTCFSIENVSWSEKNRIQAHSQIISLWAKGYYVQDKTKYEKIDDEKLYSQNFNWIKYWIEKHFFYKIFEFLLIIFISIFIIYTYFNKDKIKFHENKKDKIILFFLSFISIFFWFNTVPQFRFGFSLLIIFFYLLFDLLFILRINFDKKKFIHIFIIGLIVLNVKNINRINSEFERNDFYKFKNFPFYNEKIIKNDYSQINIKKFLHIKILE
tara:strand:+ start:166 stop:1722 length:1557 start_codon:yes stop_codon:yes gene_type:complete